MIFGSNIGKTTLLRELFSQARYFLLEDPYVVFRFRADSRSFIEEIRPSAILDEVQNVPEILSLSDGILDENMKQLCKL